MRSLFFAFILCVSFNFNAKSQGLTAMSPDSGFLGMSTGQIWITGQGMFSTSHRISWIYLHGPSTIYQLYEDDGPSYPYLYFKRPDSVRFYNWNIPYDAALGYYDLIIVRTDNSNPGTTYYYDTLNNAFKIYAPDGYFKGRVFDDVNRNKVFDSNESLLTVPYPVYCNTSSVYSSDTSGYTYSAMNGLFQVNGRTLDDYIMTTDSLHYSVTVSNDTTYGLDFGYIWALDTLIPSVVHINDTVHAIVVSNGLFIPDSLSPTGDIDPGAFYNGTDSITYIPVQIIDSNHLEIYFVATNGFNTLPGYYDLVLYTYWHGRHHLPNALYVIPDTTTGTLEIDNSNFTIYPNPANNYLHVVSTSKIIKAEIVNCVGQNVSNKFILKEEAINISLLKPGLYYLILQTENGTLRKKFVKEFN